MKLNPEPFAKIKCGLKKYELRLFDEKRQGIGVGDEIEFVRTDGQDSLTVRVVGVHIFDSFEALYAALPTGDLGYYEDEIASASPLDMSKYYSAFEQQKYGVVAIKIRLVELHEN